ncbi:ATP-binding protein [bacterium]|nr:ATP-binding protein [bacterium]NUN45985.1 response regulator [bacterium]
MKTHVLRPIKSNDQSEVLHAPKSESLRRLNPWLAFFAEKFKSGLAVIDLNDNIFFVNSAFEQMFSFSQKEVSGKNLNSFLQPPYLHDEAFTIYQKLLDKQQIKLHTIRKTKNNKHIPVVVEGWPFIIKNTHYGSLMSYSLAYDSQGTNDEFNQLIEFSNEPMWLCNEALTIEYANTSAINIYGHKLPNTKTSLFDIVRDANEMLPSARKAAIENGQWKGRLSLYSLDDYIHSEWRLIKKNPHLFAIHLEKTKNDLKDEIHLLRNQRIYTLGGLAGGIAHDLNNILTPISISISLLSERQKGEDRRYIEMIDKNVQRASHLVKQILSFSKGIKDQFEVVQPNDCVLEMARIINETFPKNIQLAIRIHFDLYPVLGNQTQIHQILMNLCVNARDAMPDGGVMTISSYNCSIDTTKARSRPGVKAGTYVAISVEDTGVGINPDIRARLFSPFFSTKEEKKGSGLGLSIVQSILRGHGGFIDVASNTGKGTVFTFYLPASSKTLRSSPSDLAEQSLNISNSLVPDSATQNKQTQPLPKILLVDDEENVLEVLQDMLNQKGYPVISTRTGNDGLQIIKDSGKDISLIICDFHMPEMDGLTFIQHVKKSHPEIKAILISGGMDPQIDLCYTNGGFTFLAKPFSIEKLVSTIREVTL